MTHNHNEDQEGLVPRAKSYTDTDIWDDDDFIALTSLQQRRYWFLTSQKDLTYAGVIGLRRSRWTKRSADDSVQQVDAELAALADARFILIDEEHEEVLIRTLIRRDGIYKQPNMLRSAARDLAEVASPMLRSAIAVELERIRGLDDIPDSSIEVLDGMRAALADDLARAIAEGSFEPSPEPSGEGSGEPHREGFGEPFGDAFGEGGRDSAGKGKGKGKGVRGSGGKGDAPRRHRRPYGDADFDAFWEAYPRKDDPKKAWSCWETAVKSAPAEEIIAGAERYRDDPNRSDQYTKLATTWLRAGSWANGPLPARGSTVAVRGPAADEDMWQGAFERAAASDAAREAARS